MTDIEKLKMLLRETDYPYFQDAELSFYLEKNNGDLNATVYECLLIKAENVQLNVSGLSTADTSKYFLRLAKKYKPSNSGTLSGGY